jgi:hypothetical protein
MPQPVHAVSGLFEQYPGFVGIYGVTHLDESPFNVNVTTLRVAWRWILLPPLKVCDNSRDAGKWHLFFFSNSRKAFCFS